MCMSEYQPIVLFWFCTARHRDGKLAHLYTMIAQFDLRPCHIALCTQLSFHMLWGI